jgi:dCMP deaminase
MSNEQIPIHLWGMMVAKVISSRSSCRRGSVGCILMDAKGKILSTGYNSSPSGIPHCTAIPCKGSDKSAYPDACLSVHAEVSAVAQCNDVTKVKIVVITRAACFRCLKLLLNTGMTELYYNEDMLPECLELLNMRKDVKHMRLE